MASMKSIKMDHFFELIENLYEVFIVSAGVSLDFFNIILKNKQLTADQLARITNFNESMVKAWCDATTACGYLKVENDKYSLQRGTKSYLTESSATNVGFMLEFRAIKMLLHPFLSNVEDRFKGNHPEFEKEHVLAIPNTIKNYAPFITPLIQQQIPKFQEKCHVLDVGTGVGAYLINLAEQNPNLTGVGIDIEKLPIEEANKTAIERKLADRLRFITMDARKMSNDEKFDIFFASNVIQALNRQDARALIKKSHALLNKDGYLVIVEILVNDDRTSPKLGAITNFYLKMEMLDAGTYSLNDLKSFISEAGFTNPITYQQLFSQSYLIHTRKS
jgi:2-polyprenyl-3-methyl-5-hydroxy-6-metoxy-1,4-benzoquinol methylase